MSSRTTHPLHLLLGLLLAVVVARGVVAQGAVARVEVTAVDPAAFPLVELRFRAIDGSGRHVAGVERAQVGIRDGETDATAEGVREDDGPLRVHFVVEAGVSLDQRSWDAARAAIHGFARGGHMRSDGVEVAVSVVRGGSLVTLIPYTTNPDDIANMQHTANPSDGNTSFATRALANLTQEMAREDPNGAQAIVFLTRQLESNVDFNTARDRSLETGVPIYTALLRESVRPRDAGSSDGTPIPPPLDEDVRRLAQDTHGVFALMNTNPDAMTAAYDDLSARRRLYVVSYRVSDNHSGTRNVQVSIPNSTGTAAGTISYDQAVDPPRVLFESPDSGSIIRREGQSWDADPALAEPTTLPVFVVIGFGTNPERRVRSVVLKVDNVEVDRADNPSGGEGDVFTVPLSWDMSSVNRAGDTNHTLVVEIEDELGLRDSASAEVTVHTTMPTQPTPGPEDPPLLPPPPPIECWAREPICSRIERPLRENPLAAISLLVALLALVFAALVWANRGKAPVQRVTQSVRRGIDRITNRYRRSEVRAYLELLAGDGDVGHRYEIYGDTPIGRSRQNAELLFQQEIENSPISRLHCTIIDEEDHFTIRDEDSANGTYLNGERLTPVVPYRLKDGDLLELARVERGGVRLRFVAATPEDTLPPDPRYAQVDGRPPVAPITQVERREDRF